MVSSGACISYIHDVGNLVHKTAFEARDSNRIRDDRRSEVRKDLAYKDFLYCSRFLIPIVGNASYHFVKSSITTNMYLLLRVINGLG